MNNYNSLDLNKIKEEIASLAFIEEAKSFILNEEIPFNPLLIKKNLSDTKEALKLLNDGFYLSFDGIYSLYEILDKASKNMILTGVELNRVLSLYNHSERVKKFFNNFSNELGLRDYVDSIMLVKDIFNQIDNAIDQNGNVKENASSELSRIYKELEINENRLLDKAHAFIRTNSNSLQEEQVYTRNNRITFLVKNVDKNKFGGFTYGLSSSNQAAYVEPSSFVELNNTKASLEEEKENEINRILTQLTVLISAYKEELNNNFVSLMKLNIIFAKANYGFNHKGIIANISDEFSIINGCHPLIDPNSVVSNSYKLNNPYQGIVISGSNTGGKTVSLKLIGLSTVMTYLGIPLIASEANIPLFDNVFVDIDDNQSISSSLSTFSAHISNINSILNSATNKSLILIDELVSGTDPKQAQAISIAIIEKIEEIGSKFVITTHFDDIKNKAYEDKNILLSSVGFNLKELKPTYKYIENSIGTSNALEIASRYLSDQSIIDRSKQILDENKTKQDVLMSKLSNEISKNEEFNKQINNERIKVELLKKELDDKITNFNNEKEELRKEYIEKLNIYIEETKAKANKILESIKEDKKQVNKLEELVPQEVAIKEEPFNVNDSVRIQENEMVGKIVSINNDVATISLNGLSVKAKLKDLHHVNANQTIIKKIYTPKVKTSSSVPHELNIVGQRVEDALIELDSYLDKAYASNYSSVRIIHGIGTGALKTAVHEKLKHMRNISLYKLADYDNGGSAVTVVEFKK